MAYSSSNIALVPFSNTAPATYILPNFNQFAVGKLDEGSSYLAWLSQTVPILKIHDMMGIVDGTEPCPPKFLLDDQGKDVLNSNYSIWCRKDQFLLSWINSSLAAPILSTMFGLHTSQQVWSALAQSFANHSRPQVSHLKKEL
jgi:hypothetical protein